MTFIKMCEQFNESAFHESDILYWSNQISKQVWYLHLGLIQDTYKCNAKLICRKWEIFITSLPVRNPSEGLRTRGPDVGYFAEQDTYRNRDFFVTDGNLNDFNTLVNTTKRFAEEILIRLTNTVYNDDSNAKSFLGFIYPTQLESFIRAINYAKRVVNCDKICDKTIVKFWNLTIRDSLFTVIHLLDPSEKLALEKAYKLEWKLKINDEREECKKYEECAVKINKKIDEFFRYLKCQQTKNLIRGVLAPFLLTVFQRYVQRALKDQTWIYCETRKRCCKGTDSCCITIDELEKFIGSEGNKCCKNPEPFRVKECNHE